MNKFIFVLLVAMSVLIIPSASAFDLNFLGFGSVDFSSCSELPSLDKLTCVVGLQGTPDITNIGTVLEMAFWLLLIDLKAFVAFLFIILGVALTFEGVVSFWFPKMEIAKMLLRIAGAVVGVFFVIPYILS